MEINPWQCSIMHSPMVWVVLEAGDTLLVLRHRCWGIFTTISESGQIEGTVITCLVQGGAP